MRFDKTFLTELICSRWSVWLILLLSFSLRIAIAGYSNLDALSVSLRGDALHDLAAQNILLGNGFTLKAGIPYSFNPPGYAFFLAGAYALFGRNWLALGFSQTSIALLTLVLIYLTTRRMFGSKAGVLATAIAGLYPYTIYHASRVMDTTLFTLFLVAAICVLVNFWKQATWRVWILLGFILGIGCLVRSTMVAVMVAIVLWLVLTLGRTRGIVASALCVTGAMLVIMPWTIRNLYVESAFIPIDSKGMVNVYMGNNPLTLQYMEQGISLDTIWGDDRLPKEPPGLTQEKRVRWYFLRIVNFAKQEPYAFLELLWSKAVYLWSPRINPASTQTFAFDSVPLRDLIYTVSYIPLIGFGIVGIVLSIRIRRETLLFLFLFTLYTLVTVLVWTSTRLRIPLDSLIAVFSGYALWRTCRFSLWR